jgi:hypothetical protein
MDRLGIVANVREAGLNRGEVGVMYVPQSQVSIESVKDLTLLLCVKTTTTTAPSI